MSSNTEALQISIVIPAFNEEAILSECLQRVKNVLLSMETTFEIIIVDDGSQDSTLALVQELHQSDPRIKGLKLSRNFGHQTALLAGLHHAKGQAVISMDADLQHPPELIPKLIEAWKQGNQIVATIREQTEGISPFKRLTSRWFYRVFNLIASTKIKAHSADFRLMDRQVVEVFKRFQERSLFLRGLVGLLGFKQCAIPYKADRRLAGESKYTLAKMLSLAFDNITSFSVVPLRLIFFTGLSILALVGVYTIHIFYVYLSGKVVVGWTSVLLSVLFLGGINLIAIGTIGEYVAKIFQEVKQRPIYIIERTIGDISSESY